MISKDVKRQAETARERKVSAALKVGVAMTGLAALVGWSLLLLR